jgi:lipoprotein NlpD
VIVLLAGLMLTACGGDRPVAPVSDRSLGMRQPESELRTVLHGDTLYSIAWESGRDYHELAAWNGLTPPYTIVAGQQLRLYPPPTSTSTPTPPPPSVAVEKKASPVPVKPHVAKPRKAAKPATPTRRPQPVVKPVVKPAKPAHPKASATTKPAKPVRHADRTGRTATNGSDSVWVWPASGRVLKNFDGNGAGKGLDIGGSKGQPVQAAAAGRVVYQGSGLRGYGQLIIVKHSDEYLSAYAHNDRIYVKEGDIVKSGQKIAAMGDSGTDQVMLHFEIRRNGKPVDPLKYLPKR